MHCVPTKQWDSTDVEQEIFKRLNKAKFDIEPSEDWGFLDRNFRRTIDSVCILIQLSECK